MDKKIKFNLIVLVSLLIIVIVFFAFLFREKNGIKNKDKNVSIENYSLKTRMQIEPKKDVENPKYSEEELAEKLKKAIDAKDYESFGDTLRIIYDYNWQDKKDLVSLESKMYVIGTDEYYKKGNLTEGLKMANIISGKVFESWRFNYLRVLCLEKFGLNKLEKGNYDEADKYAMEILSIEFRPEGVDLHARAIIEKAKKLNVEGKKDEGLKMLNELKEYELSAERMKEVEDLIYKIK